MAGPATGGALLAHTMAGLLDSRRAIGGPPTLFAPFMVDAYRGPGLSRFYRQQIAGKKMLLVDDVRNTGQTLARCATIARSAGGTVIATAEIYDRMESMTDAGAPNFALAEYKAPENYPADTCPLCKSGVPVTTFCESLPRNRRAGDTERNSFRPYLGGPGVPRWSVIVKNGAKGGPFRSACVKVGIRTA